MLSLQLSLIPSNAWALALGSQDSIGRSEGWEGAGAQTLGSRAEAGEVRRSHCAADPGGQGEESGAGETLPSGVVQPSWYLDHGSELTFRMSGLPGHLRCCVPECLRGFVYSTVCLCRKRSLRSVCLRWISWCHMIEAGHWFHRIQCLFHWNTLVETTGITGSLASTQLP